MLQRKPANRLGYTGILEIKEHPWLKYYPWKDLFEKNLESPFLPKNQDNFDKKYCEGPDKIGNDTLERYQNYYKNESLNEMFINYSFENIVTVQENSKKFTNIVNNTMVKKKINNLSTSSNNINQKSINYLLKSKMKVTESLYLNPKISTSISSFKNTPNQTKVYSNNVNLLKSKGKSSIINSAIYNKQSSLTPHRNYSEKNTGEKISVLDNKLLISKHISSYSFVPKKLINSPSLNKSINPGKTKNNSISSNSTGNSTASMNFLHKRSGSTNTSNKY